MSKTFELCCSREKGKVRRFKFNELCSPMFLEIMGLWVSSMRGEESCAYLEEPPGEE